MYRILAIRLLLFLGLASAGACAASDIEELVARMQQREKVFDSARHLAIQIVLPPTYSRCLHSAIVESGRINDDANEYAITQIDMLVSEGVDVESVQSIVAFGHGLSFATFAASRQKSPADVADEDLETYATFIGETFSELSCVTRYGARDQQIPLRRLIRAAAQTLNGRKGDSSGGR